MQLEADLASLLAPYGYSSPEGEELGFDRHERISFEASERGMCDLSERVCCCLSEYRKPDRDEEELAQLRLRAENRKKGSDQK